MRKEGGYWVRFPDDGQKYSFDDACIRSWVITEPEPEQQQQQEQRQQQQASPAKRGRPAVVEDGAAGAATPGARPSPKKARAGGGAAAASDASTVARLQSMAVALINSSRSVAKLEQAVVALERILD